MPSNKASDRRENRRPYHHAQWYRGGTGLVRKYFYLRRIENPCSSGSISAGSAFPLARMHIRSKTQMISSISGLPGNHLCLGLDFSALAYFEKLVGPILRPEIHTVLRFRFVILTGAQPMLIDIRKRSFQGSVFACVLTLRLQQDSHTHKQNHHP